MMAWKGLFPMLTLMHYPGRGVPDASDASNIQHLAGYPGYPVFVCWRANDTADNPVKVMIGFPMINSERINATLLADRDELEAAANANYKPGDSEVVLFAQFSPSASPSV
jgi:hypothetical protein